MCGETRDFSLAAFFGVREAAEAVSRSAPPPSPRRRIVQRCKDTCHAFLQLYSDSSPNGFKITIALEELGLPYALHHVRIDHGEQRRPEFLRLNPHGRIPVLVDRAAGITLFESAAILQYLAETSGRLLPDAPGNAGRP